MDWIACKRRIMENFRKYRYVMLVILAGIFLMALPDRTDEEPAVQPTAEETRPQLQDSLEDILCQISGAGKVKVLLAQAAGESTIYQTDEDISTGENSSDIRRETVLVTSSDRKEVGLVKQVNPPIYQGAIVLCQGADNAAIRLSVVEAVMSVTGLTSDRITVLKMK